MNSPTAAHPLMQLLSLGTSDLAGNLSKLGAEDGGAEFGFLFEKMKNLTPELDTPAELAATEQGQPLPLPSLPQGSTLPLDNEAVSLNELQVQNGEVPIEWSPDLGSIKMPGEGAETAFLVNPNGTASVTLQPALDNNLPVGMALAPELVEQPQRVLNQFQGPLQAGVKAANSQFLESDRQEVDNLKQSELMGLLGDEDDTALDFHKGPIGQSLSQPLNSNFDPISGLKPAGATIGLVQNTDTLVSSPVLAQESALQEEIAGETLVEELNLEEVETYEQMRERVQFGRDKSEWGPQLGSRIITMVSNEIQQAKIHLDPPELGSLEIKLQVNQDQVTAQVQVQNPQVKEVLEASANRLREALQSQGMELSGFDVGSDSSQGFGGQAQPETEQATELASGLEEGDALMAEEGSQAQVKQRQVGLLDTFA